MKKHIIVLLMLVTACSYQQLFAQREVMFTHYMLNKQEINPAFAGSRESLSIISLNRSHWSLVFDKAPITQSLNIHSLTSNPNIGIGLSFRSERLGPEKTTSFYGDFAYRIRLNDHSRLAMGLKAGVSMYDIPLSDLIIDNPGDPAFASDIQSHWLPNFGFGLYYVGNGLYAGVSIPKFLQVNYFDNQLIGGVRTILQERNYYFTAGMVYELRPGIELVPTTFVRIRKGAPVEADITANVVLFGRFSAGAMVRLQDAMGVMLGLWVSDQWSINYSFDWSILNRVPSFNFGSHELVIRYDLNFLHSHRRGPPRFF